MAEPRVSDPNSSVPADLERALANEFSGYFELLAAKLVEPFKEAIRSEEKALVETLRGAAGDLRSISPQPGRLETQLEQLDIAIRALLDRPADNASPVLEDLRAGLERVGREIGELNTGLKKSPAEPAGAGLEDRLKTRLAEAVGEVRRELDKRASDQLEAELGRFSDRLDQVQREIRNLTWVALALLPVLLAVVLSFVATRLGLF